MPLKRFNLLTIIAFFGIISQVLSIAPSYFTKNSAAKLAGWSISSTGVLDLNVSKNIKIRSTSENRNHGKRNCIWFDFDNIYHKPLHVEGQGAIKTVRLSRMLIKKTCRLVIEFEPNTRINYRDSHLIKYTQNRWKLILQGLPTNNLKTLEYLNAQRNTSIVELPIKIQKKNQVVIDPGHGGPDPGAIGMSTLRETDVVLDLSLQIAQILQSHGLQIILTRSSEIDVDLPLRTSMANRLYADLLISVHANAINLARSDINGIETFYYDNPLSAQLAKEIQRFVLSASPNTISRGVRKGRFFVIRRTLMPSVLIETGFLTGTLDGLRLATCEHRRRVALAIATGILSYIKKEL